MKNLFKNDNKVIEKQRIKLIDEFNENKKLKEEKEKKSLLKNIKSNENKKKKINKVYQKIQKQNSKLRKGKANPKPKKH